MEFMANEKENDCAQVYALTNGTKIYPVPLQSFRNLPSIWWNVTVYALYLKREKKKERSWDDNLIGYFAIDFADGNQLKAELFDGIIRFCASEEKEPTEYIQIYLDRWELISARNVLSGFCTSPVHSQPINHRFICCEN